MKRAVLFCLALCLPVPACFAALPTPEETMAIVKGVSKRIDAGDAAALDDLKTLSTDDQVGVLLMFFKGNHYVFNAEPHQKAIAAKAAKMIPDVPGAEGYFEKNWKKPSGKRTGDLVRLRETSIDCLGEMNNKFAVRVLGNALFEDDLGEQRSNVLRMLIKSDLKNPPFPKTVYPAKFPKGSMGPEGLVIWKKWWEENKKHYAAEPK